MGRILEKLTEQVGRGASPRRFRDADLRRRGEDTAPYLLPNDSITEKFLK
jgi:hypothetical protein